MALNFYNSLTRSLEEFKPRAGNSVGIYTCGPTVYDYVTVGNWRTYTLGELVARTFSYKGYDVSYYMNITDVGHLTGDNAGDADTGEDRMEKAKAREGKNAWDVADFYTKDFIEGCKKLKLTSVKQLLKATDHITEQIALVQKLFDAGLAYKIDDGIYFDTVAYEKYGELSNLDEIQAGARVEYNHQKQNPRDFALWKFSPESALRDMLWESPWGTGFPGWHIECSAMSMQYLGEQFDIHIGGEDLKSTHHPNEIAQSQGATGKSPFVSTWLHGAFLQVDGGRMGKSLGNAYKLQDLEQRGYSPLALRYFYFTGHYRIPLNFTWESLESAKNALENLQTAFVMLGTKTGTIISVYKEKFSAALENDLNMPQALAVIHELVHDESLSKEDVRATLLDFDAVLGLGFTELASFKIPADIQNRISQRDTARGSCDWNTSDAIRDELISDGYAVLDTQEGTVVFPKL